MRKNNKKTIVVFAVALIVSGIFLGINRLNAKEPIILAISSDFPITEDLNHMETEADIIVKGKYTDFKESWNMSRDDDDLSKENKQAYVEGHIYNFTITEVVSGEAKNSAIQINHHYGRDYYIEEENDSVFIVNDLYKEPEINQEYILFLKYDENFDLYYGAIEPFSIKINKDQTVELYSPLTEEIEHNDTKTLELESGRTITIEQHAEESIEDFIEGETLDTLLNELSIE
ncbi:hypothetical protein [Alkalibacterium thalassium]|uniref:Uncharacterized protein n=1 Tax=Alkalibacterium thalassium TaxID=426701 RepID=A0A1G9FKK7_9LACT|nr:hypothetical protein [Alkalibacterium thalassium]SDK88958.1 hypothetical protein SAMN04488098_10816 [Alkalibacterium thalassium]